MNTATQTYHFYQLVNPEQRIGIYTTSIEYPAGQTPPEGSLYSKFPPMTAFPNADIYFDGMGWAYGPVYKDITDQQVVEAMQSELHGEFNMKQAKLQKEIDVIDFATWQVQLEEARLYERTGFSTFLHLMVQVQFHGRTADEEAELVKEAVKQILDREDSYKEGLAVILGDYKRKLSAIDVANSPRVRRTMLYGQ